ncbi:MAG: exosortase [Sphingomonas sp.]
MALADRTEPEAAGRWPIAAIAPIVAVAILYAPTVAALASGPWRREDNAYGPFILLTLIWLAWRRHRAGGMAEGGGRRAFAVLLATGLLAHLAGRLLGNLSVEAGSVLLVAPALVGLIGGHRRVIAFGYPLIGLLFVVPLPGSLVIALTFPLKMAVSRIAAGLLQLFALPVSRQGILIEVGDYRLLVADACSGLQSMYSLAASAIVYLALVPRRPPWRIAALLLAVIPLAFAANVMRVVILALITYGFGEAAGQGFLHGFAGVVMFVIAFAGLMVVDAILDRTAARAPGRRS